jgi:flavin-dependent dehydrogenase
VPDGWLFLLSLGEGKATLIAVGDTADRLLASSRLVAGRIAQTLQPPSPPVPAYPRLLRSLVEDGTVACGTAAMSFDPLCGEGAGNAVREAFLAAGMIRAALAGADPAALAHHYAGRLTQGFVRHLQICLQFYSTGGSGSFWESQSDSLRHGIQELQVELSAMPPTRFKLVDRDVLPL